MHNYVSWCFRFPSGWKLLLSILIYVPVGLVLVLLRLLVCLQLWIFASTLPDSQTLRLFLNRGLAFAFGIIVKVSPDGEKRDEQARIVIANNISALDDFVLSTAAKTVTPSLSNLPDSLNDALGLKKMNMTSTDALVAEIKNFLPNSKTSIALQPEFSATSSRKALLKFNTWPFRTNSSACCSSSLETRICWHTTYFHSLNLMDGCNVVHDCSLQYFYCEIS